MNQLTPILDEASKIYLQNFTNKAYYGRCIFLSWYCDNATCTFCYRSTQKDRIKFAQHAERTPWSILTEAILCKAFGWKIEFLTGGYKILPFNKIIQTAKNVSQVYGKKIWINLGALEKQELTQLLPYIEGVTASIETVNPELHNKVCPKKSIEPYEDLLKTATELNLKKSITIVIGLGETKQDFTLLKEFITKHKLDRITFYPLKPVKGTPYTKGPISEYYAWWVAKTRIAFPKLEIIAGTTLKRVNEVKLLMKAGANTITKFPATKAFGSKQAHILEQQIKDAGRKFEGTLSEIKEINQDMIQGLELDKELKGKVKGKVNEYLERIKKIL